MQLMMTDKLEVGKEGNKQCTSKKFLDVLENE